MSENRGSSRGKRKLISLMFSAVMMSAFVYYVLPHWNPNFFGLTVIFLAIPIISWGLAKSLIDGGYSSLLVVAAAIVALIALFSFNTV